MTDRAKIDFIENYELTLTTKAPVHIGSGERYTKKDHYTTDGRLFIVDVGKLYEEAKDANEMKKLDAFFSDPRKSLNDETNIGIPESADRYSLAIPDLVAEKDGKGTRITNVEAFVKDAYGYPYIPGSSMKGALFSQLYRNAEELFKQKPEIQKKYSGFQAEHEIYVKRDVACEGLHAALSIADTGAYSFDTLTLCQKVDALTNRQGEITKSWGLPIFRECLKPRKLFTIRMSINNAKFENQQSLLHDLIRLYAKNGREIELFLGGGTGFLTKTVHQAPKEVETLMTRKYRMHFHGNDIKLHGKSPRCDKYTKYEGQLMLMGCCSLKIREV